ncbi:hypothetical protein ABH920_008567 [Catenulispora sp. EB89]|uniref:hypothetical protein n=1 Tax=Catenulispora sp. EB89 TaxID=3156257 RepID=UPI0035178B2B
MDEQHYWQQQGSASNQPTWQQQPNQGTPTSAPVTPITPMMPATPPAPNSGTPTVQLGTWAAGPTPVPVPGWLSPPPPKPQRRRKLILASGIGALTVAVLAAVTIVPAMSTHHGTTGTTSSSATPAVPKLHPALSQAPFMAALNTLAAAPEIHYRSTVDGDPIDIRVTGHGESVGTITDSGAAISLLSVAGKLYIKPPASGLPGVTNKAQLAAISGKWLTGKDVDTLLGDRLAPFVPPGQLADRLAQALAAGGDLPSDTDPGTVVDGVRVLTAKTSLGTLSVSRDAPYRIVSLGDGAASPPPPNNGSPTAAAAAFTWTGRQAPDTDFPTDPSTEPAATDNEILDDTKQLATAVNSDLQFKLQGNGQISCNAGGCQVSVAVSNTIDPTTANAKITGGQISAELHADVSIEGEPAGSCDSSGQLPLNNTATMGCSDPGAGGVFTSVDAEKKAAAEAQSRAENGAEVPYYVHFNGEYYVYATAQVSVDQLVRDEENQQADDQQEDPCSPANAVPSAFRTAAPGAAASCPTTARLVGPDGKPLANPDPIANKLKNYVDQALDAWNKGKIGYTRDNLASIAKSKNPTALTNALKGSILDDYVKTLTDNDPALRNLFGARSGDYGPDWINAGTTGTNRWYDLTTRKQWANHVKKYTKPFGAGIGILWS